ncbi:nuclear transport factor 2 family protein [Hymenobacter aerophilus]|uniref:nuclear transport factor 2 family protein n=1 Tax=Hymenobacter aerophilus TaxID=119644 RepID=UPI00035C2860|nr:nuclear transport factor 2 family protein [Hymenobacter aerophilus]
MQIPAPRAARRHLTNRLGGWLAAAALAWGGACTTARPPAPAATAPKPPVSPKLYRTIARLDSALFVAFNQHDADKLQTFFADDLEFYHDKGGLSDFRQTMQGFRNLFEQNKTTGLNRQLVPGTLEVFPISGYGAVETYLHRFCHTENGRDDCGTFKNMMVWRLKDGRWQITRVVSYGH